MKSLKVLIFILIIILLVIGVLYFKNSPAPTSAGISAYYSCNEGKFINATFYNGEPGTSKDANTPPTPKGKVSLKLSDGREMTLPQTLSASGVRFANADESFVFWNKGNGALVLENNNEKSYIGCIETAANPGTLPNVYSNSEMGVSIRYPEGFSVNEKYIYGNLGPHKEIYGTKLTIDPNIATSTNLAMDTYISIESIPQVSTCDAALFLDPQISKKSISLQEGKNIYSVSSSTGAGAGNRYEEEVYAIPGTNPCIAVRYYIHYGAFENYPEGSVRPFDREALISIFDSIRQTLKLVR
jgi:membrane-bound inhibitor of C-type lysozyme